MSKLTISVTDFRPLRKNSLVGFATVRINEMRLTIRDVSIHQHSNGSRWASLPARPMVDREGHHIKKDGKPQYSVVLEFADRATRDAFSARVIESLLAYAPGAFNS